MAALGGTEAATLGQGPSAQNLGGEQQDTVDRQEDGGRKGLGELGAKLVLER
jgi:hypothetical protein